MLTKVTLTLFDLDHGSNTPDKPPFHVVAGLQYDTADEALAYSGQKVSITIGDPVCGASISLPLDVLSTLVASAMAELAKHKIITPGIILPN